MTKLQSLRARLPRSTKTYVVIALLSLAAWGTASLLMHYRPISEFMAPAGGSALAAPPAASQADLDAIAAKSEDAFKAQGAAIVDLRQRVEALEKRLSLTTGSVKKKN